MGTPRAHVKHSKVWNYGQFRPPQGPSFFGIEYAELFVYSGFWWFRQKLFKNSICKGSIDTAHEDPSRRGSLYGSCLGFLLNSHVL